MKKTFLIFLFLFVCSGSLLAQTEHLPNHRVTNFSLRDVQSASDFTFEIDSLAIDTTRTYYVWPNESFEINVEGTGPNVSIFYESALIKEDGTLSRFEVESTTSNVTTDTRIVLSTLTTNSNHAKFRFRIVGQIGSRADTTVEIYFSGSNPYLRN